MDEYLKESYDFLRELNGVFSSKKTIGDFLKSLSEEQYANIEEGWGRLSKKKINRKVIVEDDTLIDIYRHGSAFTVLINEIILPFLLQKRGMVFSNEYYRIDVIGYKNGLKDDLRDEGKDLKLTPYCWEFGYAIEHENDIGKWIDEAVKLSYIKCPRKIIIGYNRPISKEQQEKSCLELNKKCFKYLLKCLEKANVPKGDNKLTLFFGVRDEKGAWDKIEYEGYVVDYSEGKVYDLLHNFQIVPLN